MRCLRPGTHTYIKDHFFTIASCAVELIRVGSLDETKECNNWQLGKQAKTAALG